MACWKYGLSKAAIVGRGGRGIDASVLIRLVAGAAGRGLRPCLRLFSAPGCSIFSIHSVPWAIFGSKPPFYELVQTALFILLSPQNSLLMLIFWERSSNAVLFVVTGVTVPPLRLGSVCLEDGRNEVTMIQDQRKWLRLGGLTAVVVGMSGRKVGRCEGSWQHMEQVNSVHFKALET